mgnify:CR=1 FL=1
MSCFGVTVPYTRLFAPSPALEMPTDPVWASARALADCASDGRARAPVVLERAHALVSAIEAELVPRQWKPGPDWPGAAALKRARQACEDLRVARHAEFSASALDSTHGVTVDVALFMAVCVCDRVLAEVGVVPEGYAEPCHATCMLLPGRRPCDLRPREVDAVTSAAWHNRRDFDWSHREVAQWTRCVQHRMAELLTDHVYCGASLDAYACARVRWSCSVARIKCAVMRQALWCRCVPLVPSTVVRLGACVCFLAVAPRGPLPPSSPRARQAHAGLPGGGRLGPAGHRGRDEALVRGGRRRMGRSAAEGGPAEGRPQAPEPARRERRHRRVWRRSAAGPQPQQRGARFASRGPLVPSASFCCSMAPSLCSVPSDPSPSVASLKPHTAFGRTGASTPCTTWTARSSSGRRRWGTTPSRYGRRCSSS